MDTRDMKLQLVDNLEFEVTKLKALVKALDAVDRVHGSTSHELYDQVGALMEELDGLTETLQNCNKVLGV